MTKTRLKWWKTSSKTTKIFHRSSSWLESKSGTSTFVAIDSDRDSCIGAMNQWFLPTRFNQLVVAEAGKDLKTICLPQSRFRLRRQVFQCLWHLCAIIAEKTDRSHFYGARERFERLFEDAENALSIRRRQNVLKDSSLINANYTKKKPS